MKSFVAKKENIQHVQYFINADGKILGRLATELARRLRGKHKVEYTPHVDTGDHIIVLNAEKILVTGNKRINKFYYKHTGYIGGIKKTKFKNIMSNYPERILEMAVKGMLPKGSLGRSMYRKLKVYAGNNYKYAGQKPQFLDI
ncbi:MAG: 50S ribosomal protein L13 [Pantoea sp. Brub]|nr:50S ribosomal protein L13 [Pantoea sp. Brub]